MKRIRTELWVLVRRGLAVRDERGGFLLSNTKIGAELLALQRGKDEEVQKCRLTLNEIN
jgi:hypothetical protein